MNRQEDDLTHYSFQNFFDYVNSVDPKFTHFLKHVDTLQIKAGKQVLCIGPATWLAELALFKEPLPEEITLVTAQPWCRQQLEAMSHFKSLYPETSIHPHPKKTYEKLLQDMTLVFFDTIVFIGAHISTLDPESVAILAARLRRGGNLYATVNGQPSDSYNNLPNGLSINIKYPIELNPNYPFDPGYFALSVEKSG